MSIRLKRGLDHILKNYGHDILLQRRTATGFSDKLERHTVRHWFPGSESDTIIDVPEGLANDVDMIYAVRGEVRPKEQDRIYEGDVGLGQQSTYIIDFAIPMRGAGGEIVYWSVGATRESPN